MCNVLLFGGTTEGRELAEFCVKEQRPISVSVTTDYGAKLLPNSKFITILMGKLDLLQMRTLFAEKRYNLIIDATHPYAVEATKTIHTACDLEGIPYIRLLREQERSDDSGTMVEDVDSLVRYLNARDDVILSTMGSKELPALTGVRNYKQRVWARLLPIPQGQSLCENLGFDPHKIIWGRGPFSVSENVEHIQKSGAELLITKETGNVGGYWEKLEAAALCNIEVVTVQRPKEHGLSPEAVEQLLLARWKAEDKG